MALTPYQKKLLRIAICDNEFGPLHYRTLEQVNNLTDEQVIEKITAYKERILSELNGNKDNIQNKIDELTG